MEKYQISIDKAKKELDSIQYMLNTTLPFIHDNRYMIKIFEEVYNSMVDLVRAILQYEYLYKRVNLYQDAGSNFETFIECARRYQIPITNINTIKKIFFLMKNHQESPIEFVKKDKFVIMSDNLHTESITSELLKEYYNTARELISRTEVVFGKKD